MTIHADNQFTVQEAIDAAQKGARVRKIDHGDIASAILYTEKRLKELHIPKKEWAGLKFEFNPNFQTFPNAYKGIPEATYFTIERRSRDWVIIDISRKTCRNTYSRCVNESDLHELIHQFYTWGF